ncbi:hypothetical protein KS4_31520 [Poriferisphaera corsica]|uniref:DUF676 domain-containing protein n=1 Tax=Poriferisphaera corsica TaxID=2528020 RepID=A0A517YXW2_9BACT|nr:hypothetical protein [Poriferisphaera corsica]QDU35074.1 hypothetical protein KS4_31520 [Poriferisphaera corsica]
MNRFISSWMGILSTCLIALGGCAKGRTNPSFPLTVKKAKHELDLMAASPKPIPRPLIILGGWMDPGFSSEGLNNLIKPAITETPIIAIAFFGSSSFNESANKLIQQLESQIPSDDPNQTVEVDVVAYSMGGLIARYAAIPPQWAPNTTTNFGSTPTSSRKRLNIKNLYTICTPHQGAALAWLGSFDPNARDMKVNSDFLIALDKDYSSNSRFNLRAYARLDDLIVGEQNTAPNDIPTHWVGRSLMGGGHFLADQDPRIIADILRNLRSEPAYTTFPSSPVPAR